MSYLPLTTAERKEMLQAIGKEQIDDLLQSVPRTLRNPKIELPAALSEHELENFFRELARSNVNTKDCLSFLGAGAYEHFIPSVVQTVISRSEFYTAYTPYQAEASQGTLQAIFEYQSLMCELTGMDFSNGSHYDGATAAAEAALMSISKTGRKRILVARSLHPDYRKVLSAYLNRGGFELLEMPFSEEGSLSLDFLRERLDSSIASVLVSSPNFFGCVEDLTGWSDLIHQSGALFCIVSNPLSMGYYKTPAEWGADISCGEAQPLGIPLSFGGPWLGYIAATQALLRQIPGRLVGMTQDAEGRRAFCLTLQAREQHIRRERASSNICTNQALCAIAACVYLAALGKEGIRTVAELNIENAEYLRSQLSALKGFRVLSHRDIFNEFAVACPKPVKEVNRALESRHIIGGLDLERFYPELKNTMLLCVTETKSKSDIDRFVNVLKEMS